MNLSMKRILAPIVAAVAITAVTSSLALADSQQNNKNLWRNLAIGGAVVAGHGLVSHNGTETLIGAAGAAYSAHRYEQDRHHQSQAQHNYNYGYYNGHRDYYRSGRHYYWYGGHEYYLNTATGNRYEVR